ncbi:MAG: hypothetical protein AB7R89_27040 [Dehalococcoidia bacterium]
MQGVVLTILGIVIAFVIVVNITNIGESSNSQCIPEDGQSSCNMIRIKQWQGEKSTWMLAGLGDENNDGTISDDDVFLATWRMRFESLDWDTWKETVRGLGFCSTGSSSAQLPIHEEFINLICSKEKSAWEEAVSGFRGILDGSNGYCSNPTDHLLAGLCYVIRQFIRW